jgi:phenylalanyl-tRNA synthetase beta chain
VFTKTEETTNLAITVSGKQAQKLTNEAVLQLSKKLEVSEKLFSVSELVREDIIRFKIRKPLTYTAEISVEELIKKSKLKSENLSLSVSKRQVHYRPVSKYPSMVRDLAFLFDKKIETEKVIDSIYKISELINRVELFDEFASDKLGKNKKNIAFHVDLQHLERTLTDKEADSIVSKAVKTIENDFSAQLRNY